MADLLSSWRQLIGAHTTSPQAEGIGRALLASWTEPHRRYHGVVHLRDVLRHVDELADFRVDTGAVKLAAWYHDSVYAGGPDDEENSARRAERELRSLNVSPAMIAEVARLVRLTVDHDPAPGDRNGETLSDADLALLAVDPVQYAANTEAVRAEYAHVPPADFAAKRARIINALLQGPSIYRTAYGRRHWEARARGNLSRELAGLVSAGRSGSGPPPLG